VQLTAPLFPGLYTPLTAAPAHDTPLSSENSVHGMQCETQLLCHNSGLHINTWLKTITGKQLASMPCLGKSMTWTCVADRLACVLRGCGHTFAPGPFHVGVFYCCFIWCFSYICRGKLPTVHAAQGCCKSQLVMCTAQRCHLTATVALRENYAPTSVCGQQSLCCPGSALGQWLGAHACL
jgi:hypothetical protein